MQPAAQVTQATPKQDLSRSPPPGGDGPLVGRAHSCTSATSCPFQKRCRQKRCATAPRRRKSRRQRSEETLVAAPLVPARSHSPAAGALAQAGCLVTFLFCSTGGLPCRHVAMASHKFCSVFAITTAALESRVSGMPCQLLPFCVRSSPTEHAAWQADAGYDFTVTLGVKRSCSACCAGTPCVGVDHRGSAAMNVMNAEPFCTDHFRMYSYKVREPCACPCVIALSPRMYPHLSGGC